MNQYNTEEIANKLFWEVLWANGKWQIYNQICIDEKSKTILIQSSLYPIFSKVLLNSLFIDICLMINRLLDPRSSMGKKNICLETLIYEIEKDEIQIAKNMSAKLKKIRDNSQEIKNLRNTTIAHTDFNIHISLDDILILKPNINQINKILDGISELMNIYYLNFEDPPRQYDFKNFKMSQDGYDVIEFLRENID